MIRTILSGLAVAAVLSASSAPPAEAYRKVQFGDMLISSYQTGGSASRATKKRVKSRKALSGQQRRQRLHYQKIPFQFAPTKDGKR